MTAPVTVGGVRWWLARDADPERVVPVLERALGALAAGTLRDQKSGRRKQLYPLPGDDGAPDHLLKVNRYPAPTGLRKAWTGSKARRELRLAEAIRARGVPIGAPVASRRAARAVSGR